MEKERNLCLPAFFFSLLVFFFFYRCWKERRRTTCPHFARLFVWHISKNVFIDIRRVIHAIFLVRASLSTEHKRPRNAEFTIRNLPPRYNTACRSLRNFLWIVYCTGQDVFYERERVSTSRTNCEKIDKKRKRRKKRKGGSGTTGFRI